MVKKLVSGVGLRGVAAVSTAGDPTPREKYQATSEPNFSLYNLILQFVDFLGPNQPQHVVRLTEANVEPFWNVRRNVETVVVNPIVTDFTQHRIERMWLWLLPQHTNP